MDERIVIGSSYECPLCNHYTCRIGNDLKRHEEIEYDTLKAKAELLDELIDCIDNLIADKAHMPSVEHLLKEAKELSK